jgi:cyclopropane-fatty-acyl-phospholipid synthase
MLVLKHAGSVRELFGSGTEKAMAEAFLRDDFDIEGDIESAFELVDVLRQNGGASWLTSLRNLRNFQRLPKKTTQPAAFSKGRTPAHSLKRDREAVSFHYDVSNNFFKQWLDRQMVYSCAYFERADIGLDEAQDAKLRLLCSKLRLRPGQRLLDIGCGWGALAIFAARNFGVYVTGITLSQNQADYASTQVRATGLERTVSIELKDYRELRTSDPFDAIVSVGMAEHVGEKQLPGYFETAARLLRPGGVFLNHAIGDGVRPSSRVGPSFIDEYVFPDSELPSIPVVLRAAESVGFEIRDVENLREHYAITLRHWVRRLEASHAEAVRLVSEATFRIWRLYMAGSAQGFACGRLAVYQTLLSKPDAEGRSHLPLTRRDWY